ncbi:MAG: type II toxin-antitoxin system VapC family toxin [Rhodomicrobium sp.]
MKQPTPMLILDTDHLTEIDRGLGAGARLVHRLDACGEEVAITIISVEEQLRGWLAQIGRLQDPHRQTAPYRRLQDRIASFAAWNVLPWTQETADVFVRLRASGVRIGSMDLKIACIALSRNATLLTRNLRHFEKVPGLRVEDWL